MKTIPRHTRIVYFDGQCGICNGFVDFILSSDHKEILKFAPLQGITAKENLSPEYLQSLSTIVYQEDDKFYTEYRAVITAVSRLGGIWTGVAILQAVPDFVGNPLYRFIAKNRYRWFGKKEVCRMPTESEKNRILL